MHTARDLIGLSTTPDFEMEPIVEASCAHFRSSVAPFERLWAGPGMYAGDFDLTVRRSRIEESSLSFLERASAFGALRYRRQIGEPPEAWSEESLALGSFLEMDAPESDEDPDEAPYDWTGSPVALALWHFAHFQTLCWDWKRMNERAGVPVASEDQCLGARMRGVGGGTFLARLFIHPAWDWTTHDIAGAAREAKSALAGFPEPMNGVPRERFAAFVDEDISRLQDLCSGNGVLANGLLDRPADPILHALALMSTGNETYVCFETEREWFGVEFVTS